MECAVKEKRCLKNAGEVNYTDPGHCTGFLYKAACGIFLCLLLFCCFSCSISAEESKESVASYSITYNLNGGSWRAGYAAPKTYTADQAVTLPAAANIVRDEYMFAGWYDSESLTGDAFTGWKAGEKTADVVLWAKWTEIITVSAAAAADSIVALTAEGSPCTVVLTGTLREEDISAIKEALTAADRAGVKVALDMSACTGLSSLPLSAFAYCSSLISVKIPGSVTSIGYCAFEVCSNLTSVEIPAGVTSIGYMAFAGCSSLTLVEIPAGVTSIDDCAFVVCSSLTDISVDESNTAYKAIDGILFTKDGKTLICYPAGKTDTYSIPAGVTSIGDYAFYGCSSLTSVEIPAGVTGIGWSAFEECSSLTSVEIPVGVTDIWNNAFYGCSSLRSVTIPDSVTSIGDCAFYFCSSLMSVTIPNRVTGIGNNAFAGCSSLTSVTIPDSVTGIGSEAFYDCSALTSLTFSAPDKWYRTTSSSDWNNKTGGTLTTLSDASTNATYFKLTYYDYYWYKLTE